MTDPTENDDPRIEQLLLLRDQMAGSPDVDWSGADVAELLDQVLAPTPAETPLDRYNTMIAEVAKMLSAALDDADTIQSLATVSVDYLRPLVAKDTLEQVAGLIGEADYTCPVHDLPDCSPMLNGCSLPDRIKGEFASFLLSQAGAE